MKTYPNLNPAPIAEAVFCIDFAGVPQLKQQTVSALMQKVDVNYRKHSDLVSKSLSFDMTLPDRAIKPETIWSGARFQSGDSDIVVLSNLDPQIIRFCYSHLRPYNSWEQFISVGKKLCEKFINIQGLDPIVKRVGIRFINHIEVPAGKSKISNVLLCAPEDPIGISSIESREFFYRDTSYYHEYKLNATSIKCTQRTSDGNPIIVVDFDVFYMPNFELSKIKWDDLLNRAHDLKNALFFGTVTEKAYSAR